MATVLVVSRNLAIAMGLSATEHDVLDLRPQAFSHWIEAGETADALVLDLDSPKLAAAAVANLRAHAIAAPVLLVSSDRPGWDEPEIQSLTAAEILHLPITRPALLAALDDLLDSPALVDDPVLAALAELAVDGDDPPSIDDELDALLPPPLDVLPASSPPPSPRLSPSPLSTVEPSPAPPPAPSARPRRRHAAPPRQRTQLPAAVMAATMQEMAALRATTQRPDPDDRDPDPVSARSTNVEGEGAGSAIASVRRLMDQLHSLYGVPETADVIVGDALRRVSADAAAVLVPDAASWRVAAGAGLRPIEHRIKLGPESWLVQQIARNHLGALIEESDIARKQLQGAPLASWRHVLAVPVPDVEAVIMMARGEDPPFDERDLKELARLGAESGPLLSAALDTRSLARALTEFRDADLRT